MHTIFEKKQKTIVILKFSMKFQTKLKYESNLKHSSSIYCTKPCAGIHSMYVIVDIGIMVYCRPRYHTTSNLLYEF